MIPEAFQSFYQNQHADRWSELCHALMQTSARCERRKAFAEATNVARTFNEELVEKIPELDGCYFLEGEQDSKALA